MIGIQHVSNEINRATKSSTLYQPFVIKPSPFYLIAF